MKKIICMGAISCFCLLTFFTGSASANPLPNLIGAMNPDCEGWKLSGEALANWYYHKGLIVNYSFIVTEDGVSYVVSGEEEILVDSVEFEYLPFEVTGVWENELCGDITIESTIVWIKLSGIIYSTLTLEPISFTCECTDHEVEGCTLGFWKNNGGVVQKNGKTDDDCWCAEYSKGDLLTSVFTGIPALYTDDTLIDALNYGGGDALGVQNMLRQAVASLLNACSGKVDFHTNVPQDIIDMVNDALANPEKISDAKDDFEEWNESENDDVCTDGRCEDSMEECNDDGLVCDPVHNCPIDSKCYLKEPAPRATSSTYDYFITSPALQEAQLNCDGCGQPECAY